MNNRAIKISILLHTICYILLLLSACQVKDEGVAVLIGLSQPNLSDNMQKCIKADIQKRCGEYDSVRCIGYDAGFSASRQAEDINRLLKQGVDALVVVTFDPEPIADAIAAAYDVGIPVIVLGYAPNNEKYSLRIYTDNVEIGKKAGHYALDRFGGERCVVLEILGDPDSLISRDLKRGFQEATREASNIKREYVMTGYWSQDRTVERLRESDFDSKEPPIDFIFAHSDMMAVGAAADARRTDRKAPILSASAYPMEYSDLDAIANGEVEAAFFIQSGGAQALDAAMRLLRKEDVPRSMELTSTLITKDNVEQYRQKE